jgi:hypothetical protein
VERAKKSRGVDWVVGIFISMDMEGVGWANAERVALEFELLGMGVVDMRSPPLLLLLFLLFMALVLGNAESVGFEGILENGLCPKAEVAPDGVVLNADVVVPPPPPPRPKAAPDSTRQTPKVHQTPILIPFPVLGSQTLVVPTAAGAFVVVVSCPNVVYPNTDP